MSEVKKKLKILMLGDLLWSPSGIGSQSKYIADALLKTGKFSLLQLGGAIKHQDYRPIKTTEHGDDLIVVPVDNYGTQEQVRSVLRTYKPDILWFMTDPRFWTWLWAIEQEVRANVPMVYYHVWDNLPYPKFNKPFYLGNDKIVTISKVTSDIVKTVAPEVEEEYLPHAVNPEIFKPLTESECKDMLPKEAIGKTVFFWTNRNARRKMSGTVLWWFNDFLKKVGKDKALLFMHTDPKDVNGQDLEAIAYELGLTRENFIISNARVESNMLAKFYNIADATINIADAEGFGLSQIESLSCGTPVIFNSTGGLQETGKNVTEAFGVEIVPCSKTVIGSQDVPYIFEDRISKEDFIAALEKIHNMTKPEREALGLKGREHLEKNYNFDKFCKRWDEIFTEVHEKYGSWETRKNYKSYVCEEF